jgi:hypothetical protein
VERYPTAIGEVTLHITPFEAYQGIHLAESVCIFLFVLGRKVSLLVCKYSTAPTRKQEFCDAVELADFHHLLHHFFV